MDFLQEEGHSSKVLDVNEDHIADYTDYLQEGDGDKTLKPTFFNHYLRETRAFMYWCQYRYIVQFCIQALFHELRDRLTEQILDVLHAADIRIFQQLKDLRSSFPLFRNSILSYHGVTSTSSLLFYASMEFT